MLHLLVDLPHWTPHWTPVVAFSHTDKWQLRLLGRHSNPTKCAQSMVANKQIRSWIRKRTWLHTRTRTQCVVPRVYKPLVVHSMWKTLNRKFEVCIFCSSGWLSIPQSLWLFDFGLRPLIFCSVFDFGWHSPLLTSGLTGLSLYLLLVINFGLLHLALTFLPRLSV